MPLASANRLRISALRKALACLACLAFLAAAQPALAHPHVWVSAKANLVFAPDGKVSAVRHHWTFDEAYSAFAVQGLDANGDGRTTPDELAGLAKTNTESLVEFAFFTVLKANGAKQAFAPPRNETMSYEGGRLTLHFELPLSAAAAGRVVVLDVSDPTFFVDFRTAEGDDAVTLDGAPQGCTLKISRPKPAVTPDTKDLSESVFQSLNAASSFASGFASRAMAACP